MTNANDSIESQLLAADEARYQALYSCDVAALKGMLAENYVHTHATGKSEDKAAFLASIDAAKYRFVRAERMDQQVRVAGPVAMLSGKTRTTLDVAGETKVMHTAFVTVWVSVAGGWQMLHWQATRLPDA
jgi:hypothetical protein